MKLSHRLSLLSIPLAAPASAEVIYSNLQDLSIPINNDGIYLNVLTGTTESSSFAGWHINPTFGGINVYNSAAFQPLRETDSALGTLSNLNFGGLISSDSDYFRTVSGASGNHLGNTFTVGSVGFIGFSVVNGADTNYGWMRVVFDGTGTPLIKDWAYDTSGGSIAAGNVIQSGSTYTLDSSTQDFTLGSAISGANHVVVQGGNTVTLAATNTYTGGTTIAAGTVLISSNANLGDHSAAVTLAGGTLATSQSLTLDSNRTITLSTDTTSALAVAADTILTFNGDFTGTGSLLKTGAGTLDLGGASSGFTGSFGINNGLVRLTAAQVMSNAIITQNGGTLELAATGDVSIGGLEGGDAGSEVAIGSGATAVIGRSPGQAAAFQGIISGAGGLRLEGGGTMTLTGNNTFTGVTTISQGILRLGDGGTSGSLGSGEVINHSTLAINRSDNLTLANVISGTGGLVLEGAGKVTITAANTFSGNTVISGGTLALAEGGSVANSSLTLNQGTFDVRALDGPYNVAAGTTLAGSGNIIGDLAIEGSLSIGSSPGTIHFDGDLVLSGISNFEFTDPTFAPESYDLATGTGMVTFGGVLNLFFSGGTYVNGSTIQIFDFANGYAGTFGEVNFTGLGDGQIATFNTSTGFVTVIPEPGTTMLAGIGLLLCLHRRR